MATDWKRYLQIRVDAPELDPDEVAGALDRLHRVLLDPTVTGPSVNGQGRGATVSATAEEPEWKPTFHDRRGDNIGLLARQIAFALGRVQPATIEIGGSPPGLPRERGWQYDLDADNFPIREPAAPIVFAPGGWGGDFLAAALPDVRRVAPDDQRDLLDSPPGPTIHAIWDNRDCQAPFRRCGYCGRAAGDPDDRSADGPPCEAAGPAVLLNLGWCGVCRRCVEILGARVPRPSRKQAPVTLMTDGNPPLVAFQQSGLGCRSCLSLERSNVLVAAEHHDFALCAWCLHTAIERDAAVRAINAEVRAIRDPRSG